MHRAVWRQSWLNNSQIFLSVKTVFSLCALSSHFYVLHPSEKQSARPESPVGAREREKKKKREYIRKELGIRVFQFFFIARQRFNATQHRLRLSMCVRAAQTTETVHRREFFFATSLIQSDINIQHMSPVWRTASCRKPVWRETSWSRQLLFCFMY